MKKSYSLIIIISLFFWGNTSAQSTNAIAEQLSIGPNPYPSNSFPLSNFHFFNPYFYNPAMAGIEGKKQLNTNWNRQSDHSFLVSYEQPVNTINSTLGMYISQTSTFSRTIRSYGLAYNYGFKIEDNALLKLGVQFSNVHFGLGRYYEDKKDWFAIPAMDLGVAFQVKQLRLGLSVQNLFPMRIVSTDEFIYFSYNKSGERKFNISIANTFKISEKWDWSLATLFRIIEKPEDYYYETINNIHDFSSYLSFRKNYFIGTTFRTDVENYWIGFVGLKIKEKVNLQFSINTKKEFYPDRRFFEALAQYQF